MKYGSLASGRQGDFAEGSWDGLPGDALRVRTQKHDVARVTTLSLQSNVQARGEAQPNSTRLLKMFLTR